VIDGEVVIWNGDRLEFDLLQQRLVKPPAKAAALRRAHPASYVAFDLLAHCGTDLRRQPWATRRRQLEEVTQAWAPPLQLTPATSDFEEALLWFEELRPLGVEGLVVKGEASSYRPGKRDWIKVKSRQTTEVIVGAVIGPIDAPQAVVAGLWRDDHFIIVGRTTTLTPRQAHALGALLKSAGRKHPWPDTIAAGHFGSSDKVSLTKVKPTLVVEVAADAALHAEGRYRHPLRYLRPRPEL
jgi:ATP-dependent DNA ligase